MLQLHSLDAFYGDSQALFGLTLEVPKGGGVALLGRNGAGKSTLMKSLLDAGPRCRGEIRLDGRSLAGLPTEARARLGLTLVPEDRRIFTNLTVQQNLELARHAVGPERPMQDVERICGLFPLLRDLLGRLGYQLSGGQQQLVAVARGLMASPTVLLLDEPAEGLAPKLAQELAAQVQRARQELGLTVLVAEQNIAFARRCTEVVHLLDSGTLVFHGDWAEFDRQPELQSRYLAV